MEWLLVVVVLFSQVSFGCKDGRTDCDCSRLTAPDRQNNTRQHTTASYIVIEHSLWAQQTHTSNITVTDVSNDEY